MRSVLCKIWNFILNRFSDVLEASAYGLKTIGEVAVPILGALGEVVGDTVGSIFGGSNLLIWLVGGYFLLSYLGKEREDNQPITTTGAKLTSTQPSQDGGWN